MASNLGTEKQKGASGRWVCCQLGAREHYAIPRVLHQNGRLSTLYTDLWSGIAIRKLAEATGSKALRSFAGRFHFELADASVVSWNSHSFLWEAMRRKKAESGVRYSGFIEVGSKFACAVRNSMRRRRDLPANSVFFAYDTGALEAFQWCRERRIKTVLNQMDPNRFEVELVREEEKHWPNWALNNIVVPEDYFRRREQEWALADKVVVNSEFCRQALVKQAVPLKKLFVMPLSYEVPALGSSYQISAFQRFSFSAFSAAPLRVLFLGQVILRKGIQYLFEAARMLKKENIHFDIVGPIGISKDALAFAPSNMTFHGCAARDKAAQWYRQSDVFVLPTLSDGFAITQLEAMAHGLPVVTTPCCGEVVTDGIDGFIIPIRDPYSLARTFSRYLSEPALLKDQRAAATTKARQFTLDHLASNLLALEEALFQ